MRRRKFLQLLGVGIAAGAAAPSLLSTVEPVCPAPPVINAVIAQYSEYVNFSDFVIAAAIDDAVSDAANQLGYQAGQSIEHLYQQTFLYNCPSPDYTSGELRDAVDNNVAGWVSYKFHNSISTPSGKTRQFFKYDTLSSNRERVAEPMNLITKTFNGFCSELGVQCTATMDPTDWRQLLHFKNVGDRTVKITHRGEVRMLQPGENVTLGTKEWFNLAQDGLPQIEAIDPIHEQEEHIVQDQG